MSDRDGAVTRSESAHEFIVAFIAANGHPPSVREIAAGLGYSTSTIHRYLEALEERGLLRRRHGLARALVLVPNGELARKRAAGKETRVDRRSRRGRASTALPAGDACWLLADLLEQQAAAFEDEGAFEAGQVHDGIGVPVEVLHALHAACFQGYAAGVRWAAGQVTAVRK